MPSDPVTLVPSVPGGRGLSECDLEETCLSVNWELLQLGQAVFLWTPLTLILLLLRNLHHLDTKGTVCATGHLRCWTCSRMYTSHSGVFSVSIKQRNIQKSLDPFRKCQGGHYSLGISAMWPPLHSRLIRRAPKHKSPIIKLTSKAMGSQQHCPLQG